MAVLSSLQADSVKQKAYMNLPALIIGLALAWLIIYSFKAKGYESLPAGYPMLLATFPLYYWCFALSSHNYHALWNELALGVVFILIAWTAYKVDGATKLALLALGFIGHGIYDVVHPHVYEASVAPSWWPEFCGSIDVILGVYVLRLASLQAK